MDIIPFLWITISVMVSASDKAQMVGLDVPRALLDASDHLEHCLGQVSTHSTLTVLVNEG